MSLLIFVMPSMFAGKQDDLKSLFSKNPVIAFIILIIIL
jgi:SWI/SNF-related matrix-associated actin-dependent regulator 1 of chromatin subfamily A